MTGSVKRSIAEERAYIPDYTCQALLDPAAVAYREICSVPLVRSIHHIDIFMPFLQEGSWRLSVDAGDSQIAYLECGSVERVTYGSWTCEEYWSNGDGGGSSGLLWADSYLLIRVPAGSVLTLYSGSGFGLLSLRGRTVSA